MRKKETKVEDIKFTKVNTVADKCEFCDCKKPLYFFADSGDDKIHILCREHFDKATKLKLEGKSINDIVKEFRS